MENNLTNLNKEKITSILIPKNINHIDTFVFSGYTNLEDLSFNGTIEEWNNISKDIDWNKTIGVAYVQCVDGQILL